MRTFAKSDVGKAREVNQDYYCMTQPDERIKIYIVADGMGGYKGGEVASKLAALSAKSYIETHFDNIKYDRQQILDLVKNAVEYANMVVYEESKKDKNLEGMGTTIDVCLIYNNKVYIGHVGDSRVYRIRKDFIRKLTVDHSYVEKLIKDGKITKEQAKNHPKKNMLLKALGCTAYVEPDVYVRGFIQGDILILASDGLTNMVSEEKIFKVVKENNIINEEEIVTKLVDEANKNGGYDNITVIIITK
ncbi:MAG: Stp1/IreP family PP2C-type Ser/Thr phosphatase [Clostridia bacterium]|nr:Stp1/IreP family PP2C-type Ser/Thr phosphatase [Clostridia bacterium]